MYLKKNKSCECTYIVLSEYMIAIREKKLITAISRNVIQPKYVLEKVNL